MEREWYPQTSCTSGVKGHAKMAPSKKKHARNQPYCLPGGFTGIVQLIIFYWCSITHRQALALLWSTSVVIFQSFLVQIAWWVAGIANFWVVFPTFVAVLTLQFSSDSAAQHNLYVKEHKVRAEKSSRRPMDRTLFVLNIPPYCSEVHFVWIGSLLSRRYALFILNANINPTPTINSR